MIKDRKYLIFCATDVEAETIVDAVRSKKVDHPDLISDYFIFLTYHTDSETKIFIFNPEKSFKRSFMNNTQKKSPWGEEEKVQWFKEQTIKRSYKDEVVTKIEKLKSSFEVTQYGALPLNPEKYPVFIVKTKNFDPAKKTILITGGVHGYETSGVHGAIAFMEKEAKNRC